MATNDKSSKGGKSQSSKGTPAPPSKVLKKKPPVNLTPEKEGTVPLSQYNREIQKNNELATEPQKATAEKVGVKTELSKWKSRALEAEKKVSDLGNEIGAVETKGFKWALKKVWPLLAFTIVILGVIVWAMAVHISKDTARENKAVNAYKAYVQDSLKRVDYKKTDDAVENSGKVISGIPRVNPADVKKN